MQISSQDGNQTPPEVLNLTKQVFTFGDGTWILPDGVEGSIIYFVLNTGGSVEDIYVQVENLRIIRGHAGNVRHNALWTPFENKKDSTYALQTAVFTDGAWNVSGGTMRTWGTD